jgi:uncharacterized membrane protein
MFDFLPAIFWFGLLLFFLLICVMEGSSRIFPKHKRSIELFCLPALFGTFLIWAISVSVFILLNREDTFSAILTVFYSFIVWMVALHGVAQNCGHYVSSGIFGEFFARNWVKMIDYVYLTASIFGLVRIATSPSHTVNAWGAVIVGIALALRITKTSIEIFAWDKAPNKRVSHETA